MSFSESLLWFKEPGFLGLLAICFLSAFFVSSKANKGVQIFIPAYCLIYMVGQWSNEDHFSMGLWWMYFGWAGFLFHKLGGMALLAGIGRILRNRFDAMGRKPAYQEASTQHQQQSTYRAPNADRDEAYQRQQEAYRQREQQRQQQQTREQSQQQSAPKPETPPKPKPAPEPKQETPPKPPEPEPKKKRPWWEVLEVPQSANLETIKKAHRTMAKRYHPDKVAHFGEEFRAKAEETAKEINAAYDEAKKRKV